MYNDKTMRRIREHIALLTSPRTLRAKLLTPEELLELEQRLAAEPRPSTSNNQVTSG